MISAKVAQIEDYLNEAWLNSLALQEQSFSWAIVLYNVLCDAIISGMVRKLTKQSALGMEVNVRVQVVQNVIIRFYHLSTMKFGELVKSHHFKTSKVLAPPAPEVASGISPFTI